MQRITLFCAVLLLCGRAIAKDQPVRSPITGIAFVRIAVSNLENSREFYERKLGLASNLGGCRALASPCFAVNGTQYIALDAPTAAQSSDLLTEVGFATTSVAGLQRYLGAHGVKASEISASDNESQFFTVFDPEHHRITFVQQYSRETGSTPSQVSTRLIHAGFVVHDRAAEDRFYKDILGFHVYWHGGMKDDKDDWVDMQVPDGTDWIEYMLNVSPNADKKELGVMNHIALGVKDIHAAEQQLLKNGWKPGEKPQIGRDGKWQLNLYDPDDTRVELMEFTPVEKPCCSDYTGPHPKP